MYGSSPRTAAATSLAFVAPAALDDGLEERLGLGRRLVAVADTGRLGKADMPNNTARPDIRVDPDSFEVRVDGEVVVEEPSVELPMAQRYFLF